MALGHQSTKCLTKRTWRRARASKNRSKASSIKLPTGTSRTPWLGCEWINWNPMVAWQMMKHATEVERNKIKPWYA